MILGAGRFSPSDGNPYDRQQAPFDQGTCCLLFLYMYSSHSLRMEHAFLMARAATETMAPLTFLAPLRH